jgi:dienelactone hydrolase
MLTLLLALALQTAPTEAQQDAVLQPSNWLVIDAVDERGRRPFREDAVFARYLLKPGVVPQAGQEVTGVLGAASWQPQETEGRVRMRGRGAYAFAQVEVEEAGIYLAELRGATTLFLNGEATAGDVYRYNFDGYPVALRAGSNDLFVTGARGGFDLSLRQIEPGLRFGSRDRMLPDLLHGVRWSGPIGLLVMNASEQPLSGLRYTLEGPDFVQLDPGDVLPQGGHQLGPFAMERVQLSIVVGEIPQELNEVRLTVRETSTGASTEVVLRVREAGQLHRRTYLSAVDASVQEYAVLPPTPGAEPSGPMRFALSLHGAGVGCLGQAGSYQQKDDFWIVAPTNRRKFGFDWQDWGRRDAYDVLEQGLAISGVDPRFVYVTGHSMGGHGTWHLAANDPDRFAASGPSAGWATFDTYGGRPLQDARWLRADAASLTLELVANLKQVPPYIIHGSRDDNVPPAQALTMLDALTRENATVRLHMQGGAGHWWGGQCVDWPPLFDHFRAHELAAEPAQLELTVADPSVDWKHHWLRLRQPLSYGEASQVSATWSEEQIQLTTKNVRRVELQRRAEHVVIDGELLPAGGSYVRGKLGWELASPVYPQHEKDPERGRAGPFKQAFRRGFIFVVGTQGDAERDAALLARARHDAGVWTYRGNGNAPIRIDQQILEMSEADREAAFGVRNLILYGNRDDNAAWSLFGDSPPIDFADGHVRLGEQTWQGDYAGVFVLPSGNRMIAAFASTSTQAARFGDTFAPFISGVGYPDYAVLGIDALQRGDEAVVAAGWFDHAWQVVESQER